jgi:uncharacterized protein involved in exopolysaccharide biosynthesis
MTGDDELTDRYEEEGQTGLPEFLTDPVGVVRRRWALMVPCFLVGIVATAVALIAWHPTYLANATVLLTSQQIPEDFVRSTVQEDTLANVNAMIGQVLSAENLSALIDANHLFPDSKASRIDLVNQMRSKILQSRQSKNTDALVYDISYESVDPNEAAQVANALAALFVESSLSRRNTQARRTTLFLRQELERDEAKLREQSRLVSEFRRKHRGELPDELETGLRKLDMLSARRQSIDQQIATKENHIMTLASSGGVPSENEVLLGELRRELARQTAAHTDEHPNVIALRDRIARLEATPGAGGMAVGTKGMIEAERRDIASLQQQLAAVDAEIAEINSRVDVTPRVAEELGALEQKEQVLREDYLSALRKVEEAQLAESLESAQQGGQVSVLDEAQPPTSPVRPRSLIALAGLAITFVLTAGIGVLFELIDPVIVGVRNVKKWSDSPVLGSLPYVA